MLYLFTKTKNSTKILEVIQLHKKFGIILLEHQILKFFREVENPRYVLPQPEHEKFLNVLRELVPKYLKEGIKFKAVQQAALFTCAKHFTYEETCSTFFSYPKNCQNDSEFFGKVLDGFASNKCVEEGKFFIEQLCGLFPDMLSQNYNIFLNFFLTIKDTNEAITFLRKIDQAGLTPSFQMWKNFIELLGESSLHKDASFVVDAFVKRSTHPDMDRVLIKLYSKWGIMGRTRHFFYKIPESQRDASVWTALINCLLVNGDMDTAFIVFDEMKKSQVVPSSETWKVLIEGCIRAKYFAKGESFRKQMLEQHVELNPELKTVLFQLSSAKGNVEDAQKLYKTLQKKTPEVSNSMIVSLCSAKNLMGALHMFNRLLKDDFSSVLPSTWIALIKSCGDLFAEESGRKLHKLLIDHNPNIDYTLASVLIEMYSKLNCLEDALQLCGFVHSKIQPIAVAGLILAYGQNKQVNEAIKFYEHQRKFSTEIFAALLHVCAKAKLLIEAKKYFHEMETVYRIAVAPVHYNELINAMCRLGKINEAEAFLKEIKVPLAMYWRTFLVACRYFVFVEKVEFASKKALALDAKDPSLYEVIAECYAAADRKEDYKKFMDFIVVKKLAKNLESSIEVDGKLHIFGANFDDAHEHYQKVLLQMNSTHNEVNTNESNIFAQLVPSLHLHPERISLAFGLLTTPPQKTLKISTNIRINGFCHEEAKFISQKEQRTIIIKDPMQIHIIKNGSCCCSDYF